MSKASLPIDPVPDNPHPSKKFPPRTHTRPTATPEEVYHAPARPCPATYPAPFDAAQVALHQRLTAQQCIEAATFLYDDESYALERVRIGGRGYRDVLGPMNEGSPSPRFLIEGDARGLFVARWQRPGHREEFGEMDEPAHRAFICISRALDAGLLWRGWSGFPATCADSAPARDVRLVALEVVA